METINISFIHVVYVLNFCEMTLLRQAIMRIAVSVSIWTTIMGTYKWIKNTKETDTNPEVGFLILVILMFVIIVSEMITRWILKK